jgi:MFS family permease
VSRNPRTRGPRRALLQIPDVRRMWLSDLLSLPGDNAAVIALAVLVYGRTHSAGLVAITSAAAYAPALGIGPLLATFADRYAYRSVLIASDLFRAAAYAAILIPGLPVAAIIAIVFAAHCSTFPFTAARGAQLPQLAGEQYGAAQQLFQSTYQLGSLMGYAIGGALVALGGARGAIALDAASFAVSAALIARVSMRARTENRSDEPRVSAMGRMMSGARTLRTDPLLFWPAVMVTSAAVGVVAAQAMAVVLVRELRPATTSGHGSGPWLALLLILPMLVAILASALCPTKGAPRRLVRASGWMAVGSHGLAVTALLFAHHGRFGVALAALAYAALGVSEAMTVPCVTVVGQRLPSDNRASVFSLLQSMLVAGQAAGALLAALAVAGLGVNAGICVLLLPAIAVAGLALSRLSSPTARHLGEEFELVTVAA